MDVQRQSLGGICISREYALPMHCGILYLGVAVVPKWKEKKTFVVNMYPSKGVVKFYVSFLLTTIALV